MPAINPLKQLIDNNLVDIVLYLIYVYTMTETVNTAICELDSDAYSECLRFQKNHQEMRKLHDQYSRYRELSDAQMRLRGRITKIRAVLGVHFTFNSVEVGKLIDPLEISSSELRKHLKLWEILELLLSAVGKVTAADVEDFVTMLGIDEVSATPQAIDSAVKAHPELFREMREGRNKFYLLNASGPLTI